MTAKPKLRLVGSAPELRNAPERFGDYRDYLKRPSRSWAIEHTVKQAGEMVATGTGFDRHD